MTLGSDRQHAVRIARRGVIGAFAAALLVGPAAASEDRLALAQEEGRLVLFSGQSNEFLERLKVEFEARHEGVTLEFLRADLSQVIQRFVTESAAGRPTADVLDLVERRAVEIADLGLAAQYVSPYVENFPEDSRAPDGLWTNYLLHLGSFAYNTDTVSDPPQTWDDLLDPKWQGRIGIQNPVQGGGAAIWVITMFEAWGEERWTDFMTRLAAQDLRMGNYFQVQDMLAGGEVDIQVAAYPNFVEPFHQRTGAPVSWAAPDPTMRTFMTLSIAENAANPNAARLFVDFMASPEGQSLMSELQLLPVLEESRSEAYARLDGVPFADQAWRLEATDPDWFRERIREFFAP